MERTEFFEKLYGNEQLKNYLVSGIREASLPHALIFEGTEGSGKKTAAFMTAATMQPEFSDKILRTGTPDVTLYGPEEGKKSIGIALIREIKYQAYIKPQELDFRLFIIEHSEIMTTEAQNALLKVLEEPPAGVYFFLLCESASALLPTVRSRAPVLRMEIFNESELSEYLAENDKKAAVLKEKSPEEYGMLVKAACGTVGGALKLLGNNTGDAEKTRKLTDELITALAAGVKKDILLFFVRNVFQREELDLLLSELQNALRDMLKCKYTGESSELYFLTEEKAEEAASQFAKQTLMSLFDNTEELRSGLLTNVNAQTYSLKCAEKLAEAI